MTEGRLPAAISIIVLCVYFVIDNHVRLPPWNNLDAAGPQLRSTLTGIAPMMIGLIGLALRIRWLVAIVAAWSVVWFAAQMQQWWIPYLFGPTPLHADFSWFTEKGYAQTLAVLPRIADRPAPDAQHLTLEALSLITAWLLVRAALAPKVAVEPDQEAADG